MEPFFFFFPGSSCSFYGETVNMIQATRVSSSLRLLAPTTLLCYYNYYVYYHLSRFSPWRKDGEKKGRSVVVRQASMEKKTHYTSFADPLNCHVRQDQQGGFCGFLRSQVPATCPGRTRSLFVREVLLLRPRVLPRRGRHQQGSKRGL